MSEANETNSAGDLKRRELLKKLGKNGIAYTSPAVLLLLSSSNSFGHANPPGSPIYTMSNDCRMDDANHGSLSNMAAMTHCTNEHGV